MNWFSGTLRNTSADGWEVFATWHGISFDEAYKIVNELRVERPDLCFEYVPYTTVM